MERSRCRKSSSEGCTSWNRFLVWWLSVRRGRLILVVQLKREEDKKLDHGSNVSSRLLIKLNRCFGFPITKLNYPYYNNKQGIQLFILEWGHKQRGSDSDAGQIIVRPRLQKAEERLAADLQTMCQFMHTDTVSVSAIHWEPHRLQGNKWADLTKKLTMQMPFVTLDLTNMKYIGRWR